MIAILSSGYLEAELQLIFGKIPPCFLPYGNKYLIEHQIARVNYPEEVVVTLPSDYELSDPQRKTLDYYNIKILYLSHKLTIGEVISSVINSFDCKQLEVLYGDTLLEHPFDYASCVVISEQTSAYNWYNIDESKVWCGFFKFDDVEILRKSLVLSNDWFEALRVYEKLSKLDFVEINSDLWLDFGHLQTFFAAKKGADTSRNFNTVSVQENIVFKRSKNIHKLRQEYLWFQSIQGPLKLNIPRIINWDDNLGYDLEYVKSLSLAELVVFGQENKFLIDEIFTELRRILTLLRDSFELHSGEILNTFLEMKFRKRASTIMELEQSLFGRFTGLKVNDKFVPALSDLHQICVTNLTERNLKAKSHGDFCASNLLYCPWNKRVVMIDPRGKHGSDGEPEVVDQRYDLAKLGHSIIGGYDHILAGHYSLSGNTNDGYYFHVLDDGSHGWRKAFWDLCEVCEVPRSDIYNIIITLFITMVPLHTDNRERQLAFLLNAFRLYGEMYDYHTNGRR